ncbi:unnamed protein product [Paramecium octaurelia]|uniref:Uncharacterized protein n=1 Tax=Paramecium octaurelia TaxID=43137 RepID=A0A8S1TTD5_PAROT|nr:unnamed protein product [Paramecium octaurelia]
MSFNNQNYICEEFKVEEIIFVPDIRQTKSIVTNPNKINKKYSICSFCLAYQENEDTTPYQCKNITCGKFVKIPIQYEVFQCPTCYANILHQPQSSIICSQCKKVVKWSDQLLNQASQISQGIKKQN